MNLVTGALLGESNKMGECLMLLLVRTVPSALEMATAGSGQGGQRVGKNAANEGPVKCR